MKGRKHQFIIGIPGSGKSFTLRYFICQTLAKDSSAKVVIIAPNMGYEYLDLVAEHEGTIFNQYPSLPAAESDTTVELKQYMEQLNSALNTDARVILVDASKCDKMLNYASVSVLLEACEKVVRASGYRSVYIAIDDLSALVAKGDHSREMWALFAAMNENPHCTMLAASGDVDVFCNKGFAVRMLCSPRSTSWILGMYQNDAVFLAQIFNLTKADIQNIGKNSHPRGIKDTYISAFKVSPLCVLRGSIKKMVQISVTEREARLCSAYSHTQYLANVCRLLTEEEK